MREKLAERDGERDAFSGAFARYGVKPGWRSATEPTVLLTDIRDGHGNEVCDHLWFNLTEGFAGLVAQPGDVIAFHARVAAYEKGYRGGDDDLTEWDYKLSYPTRFSIRTRTAHENGASHVPVPAFRHPPAKDDGGSVVARVATSAQKAYLTALGVTATDDLSIGAASKLIDARMRKRTRRGTSGAGRGEGG